MDKLPKSARDRLQQSGPAGAHPDANVISAFVEGALTQRERAQVIEHLAQCAECRAVAGYALPESAVVAPIPVERTWMRWTVIRWGTLAVSAVIIAVAVLVLRPNEPRLRPATAPTVSQAPAAQPAPETAARKADEAPAAHPEARAPEKQKGVAGEIQPEPKREEGYAFQADRGKEQQPPVPSQNVRTGALALNQQRVGGPSQSNVQNQVLGQQNQNVSANAAPPPPPPASVAAGAISATSPSTAAFDRLDKLAQGSKPKEAASPSPQKAPAMPGANEAVEVTATPVSPATTRSREVGPAPALGMKSGVAATRNQVVIRKASADDGMVRWTVGEGGHVLRSLDGGRTWTDVAVAERVVFRALSAIGSDVWAGGAGGVLFHSSDAGAHWTRVRPTSNGTELAADIVRIEFTDLQHGSVTTADGARWVTADGGQSWSVIPNG